MLGPEKSLALVAKALALVASLLEGGSPLYRKTPRGRYERIDFGAEERRFLAAFLGEERSADGKLQLSERVRDLTGGLLPHPGYGAASLAKLVAMLEADPFFTGPFEGRSEWSAAPIYGRGAVGTHQSLRKRRSRR